MQTTRLWTGVSGRAAALQVARQLFYTGSTLVAASLIVAVGLLLLSQGELVWLWSALFIQFFAVAGGLLLASAGLIRRSLYVRGLAMPAAKASVETKQKIRRPGERFAA